MAEDLTTHPPDDGHAAAAPAPPARSRVQPAAVHVARFRLIYAVLAVVLGAAVGTFVVLAGDVDTGGGAKWSSWEPTGSSSERAGEIASFVADRYRLESGKQLVAVTVARPPTVQRVPVSWVAIANGPNQRDISVMDADDTVAYVLCGLGQNCAIGEGPASVERGRLLRREAFELALYTFKYVDGASSVVAFLPPRAGARPRFALFFQKGDSYVRGALHRPLTQTLAPEKAITPSTLGAQDNAFITSFVEPHLFQYSFNQAGDGSVYLALQPLAT